MRYDSPLLAPQGGRDGRSPGVATLKEAFDITYAVHRMEEEGARRRAYGAGDRGFLNNLNEEAEDEAEDVMVVEEVAKKHGKQAAQVVGAHAQENSLTDGRAGVRDQGKRRTKKGPDGGFALDMGNATLLGRRNHRRTGALEPSPLGQGVARARAMSPMQID